MNCNETRELFAEALYGELPDARMTAFNAHLASCEGCSREFSGLKQTIDALGRRARVEPSAEEWAAFSARLEERLEAERRTDSRGARRPTILPFALRPSWAYGVAAVLLVAFGIYMGRTFFNGVPDGADAPGTGLTGAAEPGTGPAGGLAPDAGDGDPAPGGLPGGRPAVSSDAAAVETNREALAYLERSRNLLLGLTNLDGRVASPVIYRRSREVSRELYDRGNTLAVALDRPSQQQLRQLVQGLQIILLQLSNMEVGEGTPVIEMVKQGVDAKSILLKINLEAIRAALAVPEFRPAESRDNNL